MTSGKSWRGRTGSPHSPWHSPVADTPLTPCGAWGSAHSRLLSLTDDWVRAWHCARHRRDKSSPLGSHLGLPRDPGEPEGQRPRPGRPSSTPLSWPPLQRPAEICPLSSARRPPRAEAPNRHLPRPPGQAADQAREGSPRLKRALSRRGGLGRFARGWLSHPSSSAPEFLRRFQTQRLGARDTPGSVCQALPWEGVGWCPEDAGELSPP